jgi:hypothetical protein
MYPQMLDGGLWEGVGDEAVPEVPVDDPPHAASNTSSRGRTRARTLLDVSI